MRHVPEDHMPRLYVLHRSDYVGTVTREVRWEPTYVPVLLPPLIVSNATPQGRKDVDKTVPAVYYAAI